MDNKNFDTEKSQVRCDVKNCKYHFGKYGCSAEQIKVGHGYASSSDDTVCDTFKPTALG